jgi:hypothetical protein
LKKKTAARSSTGTGTRMVIKMFPMNDSRKKLDPLLSLLHQTQERKE